MVDSGDLFTDRNGAPGDRDVARGDAPNSDAGAEPLILGGDEFVPIPWFTGFEGRGPYTVLQVDAHADWADVVLEIPSVMAAPCAAPRRCHGSPASCSSARAKGSGGAGKWRTPALGRPTCTMRNIRRDGMRRRSPLSPMGRKLLVSIDCDGMDRVLPAVDMPTRAV